MKKRISLSQRDRLLDFIGYGRLTAPIWFLGMEEGTGGGSELEFYSNLQERAKFRPTMDLHRAHLKLRFRGKKIEVARIRSSPTPVWIWMARIEDALRSSNLNAALLTAEEAKSNIRKTLGRWNGTSLLMELLPLPARNIATWPYPRSWFPGGRREYRRKVLRLRSNLIRRLLRRHRPDWLVAYGVSNYVEYQRLCFGTKWRTHAFKIGKRDTWCYTGKMNSTRVLLVPFLGNGQISKSIVHNIVGQLRGRT
jgi:hypothetical protein